MRLLLPALCVAMPLAAQRAAPLTAFVPGMIVTRSVRIAPGSYVVPASDSATITVRGSDITVDLRGVELVGNADREHPDQFSGIALRVDGGRNVTVRGLHARGYKVGIVARNVTRLSLLDNDLSYNWRPRLYSGIVKESLVDWLDYHNNEHDEWLRYGAGIYLSDITIGELRGNRVVQGMNGLLMTRSTGVRIWNNTFSYNSGLGVGMYRATRNVVMHNAIDWNVRGYSHGFFNRGQDSAGLLMYEQSSNNSVAYNSVTHSGDGLFLWAGQSTMDTGAGGANDNVFYRNDFSFAPTNAMEATFSRNTFVENRATGSWHGLWGGYSYHSVVLGNRFGRNVEAIAIEHGQGNVIAGNTFAHDTVAVHLWWNKVEPSDWGYPKHRDTRSTDYRITSNTFRDNHVALRIDNSSDVRATGNHFFGVDTVSRVTGDSAGWRVATRADTAGLTNAARYAIPILPNGRDVLQGRAATLDRTSIIVDEWGPYDGLAPKLWPVGRDDGDVVRLRVMGPAGHWRVQSRAGVELLSKTTGMVGDTITVAANRDRVGPAELVLSYTGGSVVTRSGVRSAAGVRVQFGWRGDPAPIAWHVRFVAVDSGVAVPMDTATVRTLLAGKARAEMDTSRLDLTWYAPPLRAIPGTRVLTEATATVTFGVGATVVRTIADDAVRVYLDGRLILDDWVAGESHVKQVTVQSPGAHRIRVEHLQLDGWYELRLDVEPQS